MDCAPKPIAGIPKQFGGQEMSLELQDKPLIPGMLEQVGRKNFAIGGRCRGRQ